MAKLLSDDCIRASWEAEREDMRAYLLTREVPFNEKSVDKFIDNYISSMVFAKLPCKTKNGIAAAWKVYRKQN